MLSLARSDPVTGQGLLILARPHDEFQILDHLTRKKTFFMAAKTKALTFTPPKHLSKESTEFFRKTGLSSVWRRHNSSGVASSAFIISPPKAAGSQMQGLLAGGALLRADSMSDRPPARPSRGDLPPTSEIPDYR